VSLLHSHHHRQLRQYTGKVTKMVAAFKRYLEIVLIGTAICNAQQSGQTTLDASACATPSCTVTPTVLSSITIRPSPATVHPPGALLPVVVSFEPFTLTSFQPETTVLSNPGTGVLTLGTTKVSGIKVTTTTSYFVSPTQTLDVAVVADVRGETQLFFAFETNDDQFCEIAPRSLLRSRIARGLSKRRVTFQDMGNDGSASRTYGNNIVDDARTVLNEVIARLESEDDPRTITDKGYVFTNS
jgi:hypothetical protein